MALPNVLINLQNGALGSVSDGADGVAALVLTGVVTTGIPLGTPKVIYSLADAEGLGITEEGDNAAAYRHIKEFYDGFNFITGKEVAELYIILLSSTVTLAQAADVTATTGANSLLQYAKGRVRLLGLTRTPDSGYEADVAEGVDADSLTALANAHVLCNTYATAQAPLRALVEMRGFKYANIGDLKDLKTYAYNRAAGVLWSTQNDGSASVGYTLGVKAGLPVQRKISRVKNGLLSFTNMYIGDTLLADVTAISTIHDKGYIAMRTFPTRSGYYFTGEPMACPATDDYAILSRGCVIDKGQRISYDSFLDEVEDDIQVDSDGQLLKTYKAYLEKKVTNAVSTNMSGEISDVSFSIPDGQNILSTANTDVVLKITPVGYQTTITVKLGFQNPAS